MHTVVRSYSGKGAKELFDVLEKNKADVEKTLRSVKSLVSYTLVRSADGGFSVTVCNDKAGTDESLEKARDYREERRGHWCGRSEGIGGISRPSLEITGLESGAGICHAPDFGRPRAHRIRPLPPIRKLFHSSVGVARPMANAWT